MSSPRSNIVLALLIALAFHAVLAVVLALYLSHAPAPDELAQLDLTSVDLSFAETVEETAAAVASAPSKPSDAPPPVAAPVPVEAAFLPPSGDAESLRVAKNEPSFSDAVRTPRPQEVTLPTPAEPIEEVLKPVAIEQKAEVERRETRDEKPEETRDEKTKPTEAARTPPQQTAPPQQASAPRQARVDAPPKPRRPIKPDYPREARLRGEQGDVSLELDVAADGSVGDVRILKSPGFPLLEEAAIKAARNARFTPAKSGGTPVASTVRLTLNFKLK